MLIADIEIAQSYSWMSDKRGHKNTKTHCHNGDAEKDDEDDKDEQGRRQM